MEQKPIDIKKGFFKKAKLSICNIERYPELASEGMARAISYLVKIVIILTIVIGIGLVYKTTEKVKEAVQYIENEFPDFSYQDGKLDVKSEEPITVENDITGKIVIDTKSKENTDQYENCILVLDDEFVVKNEQVAGTTTYKYKEIFEQLGITRFEKQDVINYTKGIQMISLYISLFFTLFIYTFAIYFINTLLNTLLISAFGYLASIFTKIKMRYKAIFNMSIYAITLSVLLNIIYVIVNIFTDFNIEYFDVMYISVAVIYLFAAIFMIKADLLKRQIEVTKIVEVQKEVKKEIEKKEEEERQNQNEKPKEKEPKDKDKEGEEDKKEDVGKSGPTPEGTSA